MRPVQTDADRSSAIVALFAGRRRGEMTFLDRTHGGQLGGWWAGGACGVDAYSSHKSWLVEPVEPLVQVRSVCATDGNS